jgi:hypothetical protein
MLTDDDLIQQLRDYGGGLDALLEEATSWSDTPADHTRSRRWKVPAVALVVVGVVAAIAVSIALVTPDHHPAATVTVGPSNTPMSDTSPSTSVTPLSDPVASRSLSAAVWTGHQLLVWGGEGTAEAKFGDGAAYDPTTNQWQPIPTAPISARSGQVSVWTGTEMLIVGGTPPPAIAATTGGAYNPDTHTWRLLPESKIDRVSYAGAVWTGSEMIVVGGTTDGATLPNPIAEAYTPSTNQWRRLPDPPAPIGQHAQVQWTGTRVATWLQSETTGSLYLLDPAQPQWTTAPSTPPGEAPLGASLVWDGRSLNVWGLSQTKTASQGAAFDLAASKWTALPPVPGLAAIAPGDGLAGSQAAAYTNSRLFVWPGALAAGGDMSAANATALWYDPATSTWQTQTTTLTVSYSPTLVPTPTGIYVLGPPAAFVPLAGQ